MKQIIITTALFILGFQGFSQSQFKLFTDDADGKNYYKEGTLLINAGEYSKADSLFSLALCTFKNEDVYFNRAVSRLFQFDTIGFCEDLSVAANKYFDNEAEKLFAKNCCHNVDTFYYNKKYLPTSKENHRYYEEIRVLKYKPKIIGIVHDIKAEVNKFNVDFGCENNLLSMNSGTTDIIAVYELKDSVKYYKYVTKKPSIYNTGQYSVLKEKAKIYLSAKYADFKKEYSLEKVILYYYITISEEGVIEKVEYAGLFPEVYAPFSIEEIEKDIMSIIGLYPKIKPAKFMNKKVKVVGIDMVSF